MTEEHAVDSDAVPAQYRGLMRSPVFVLDLMEPTDTITLGRLLGAALHDALVGHVYSEVFVGLVGGLGAGKTTFMQGFVSGIDAQAEATSPTYALVNVYELDFPVVHMDLYRLENLDDLESIGYWDYAESEGHILCVEWIDRIPQAWSGKGILLELTVRDERRQLRMWGSQEYVSVLADVCEEFASGVSGSDMRTL